MHKVFERLIRVAAPGENARLLVWESHWYTQGEPGSRHADDLKRETLPLKLAASAEEIRTFAEVLKDSGAELRIHEGELEILFAERSRQPEKLLVSAKKHAWFCANLVADDTNLAFREAPTVKDALTAAVLLARFPQISFSGNAEVTDKKTALELPQSLRRHAFKNIISGRRPSQALKFLDSLGLLDIYLPEVTAGRHLTQNRFHAHDIFEHLLHSVDGAYDLNEPVRWSALLHDVGKVPTRVEGPNGEASFHNHEMYSARMVVPIMKRLAVPIGIGQKVKFLVRNHMFHYTDEWSDKAVRRFVKKIPLEELQDLISLRLADRKGSGKKTAFPKALQNLMHHIDEIIAKEKEFKIKDLAIDGHMLMELGMPPSRAMGDMLKYLFEEVKAGRLENNREVLIEKVKTRREETAAKAPT